MIQAIFLSRLMKAEAANSPARAKNAGCDSNDVTKQLSEGFRQAQNSTATDNWPSKKSICLLALATVVALGVSGYLVWVAFTSSKIAGCGGGRLFNCGHVTSSRWSLWIGIPVSVLAVGCYAGLGAALCFASIQRFAESTRRLAWFAVSILALSAGIAGLWFTSLQVFSLGHLCTYCLLTHFCGMVAAATVLWVRPNGVTGLKIATPIAMAGFAVLAGFQLASEEPASYKIETFEAPKGLESLDEFEAPVFKAPGAKTSQSLSRSHEGTLLAANVVSLRQVAMNSSLVLNSVAILPKQESQSYETGKRDARNKKSTGPAKQERSASESRRFVTFNGGAAKLDVAQWPIVGSPDAKYVFIEMFDYACPHCRNTHVAIKDASNTLNGDLAVITLPVPLNARCNNAVQVTGPKFAESCEISKLAVAVWRVNPAKFTDFHNWMISAETVQTYAQAKAMADTMVDTENLGIELASEIPGKYVAQHVELYKRAGAGNVPKLIFPTTTIVGEFTSSEKLVQIIREQLQQ